MVIKELKHGWGEFGPLCSRVASPARRESTLSGTRPAPRHPEQLTQPLVPGRREPGRRCHGGPGALRAVAADRDVPARDGLQHAALALLRRLGT